MMRLATGMTAVSSCTPRRQTLLREPVGCGYRVRYVPTARARHEDGGSGRSPALGALLAVNRVRYYEKYHRRPATSLSGLRSLFTISCAPPIQISGWR